MMLNPANEPQYSAGTAGKPLPHVYSLPLAWDMESSTTLRTYLDEFIVRIQCTDDNFIADDFEGLTYGVGETAPEAFLDWKNSLHERLEVLREVEPTLAPHLTRELARLRRLLQQEGSIASSGA